MPLIVSKKTPILGTYSWRSGRSGGRSLHRWLSGAEEHQHPQYRAGKDGRTMQIVPQRERRSTKEDERSPPANAPGERLPANQEPDGKSAKQSGTSERSPGPVRAPYEAK